MMMMILGKIGFLFVKLGCAVFCLFLIRTKVVHI